MNEWYLRVYGEDPHWVIIHIHDNWEFYVWPHETDKIDVKHHCVKCHEKAPDHLILQQQLLNGK